MKSLIAYYCLFFSVLFAAPLAQGMYDFPLAKMPPLATKRLGSFLTKKERGIFRSVSRKCNKIMSCAYPLDKKEPVIVIERLLTESAKRHYELVIAIDEGDAKFPKRFFPSGNIIHYSFSQCMEIAYNTGIELLPNQVALFYKHAFEALHAIENTEVPYEDEVEARAYLVEAKVDLMGSGTAEKPVAFEQKKQCSNSTPDGLYNKKHYDLVSAILEGDFHFAPKFFKSYQIIDFSFDKCMQIAGDTGEKSALNAIAVFYKHAYKSLHKVKDGVFADEIAANDYLDEYIRTHRDHFADKPRDSRVTQIVSHAQNNTNKNNTNDVEPVRGPVSEDLDSAIRAVAESIKRLKEMGVDQDTNQDMGLDINRMVVEAMQQGNVDLAQWLFDEREPGTFSKDKCIHLAAVTGDALLVVQVVRFLQKNA
jgi:hypothetical protein